MASTFGVGQLHVKSFGPLVRATPLRRSEAEKWSIGDGFNDYRLLSDYLANLSDLDKEEIIAKANHPGVHLDNQREVINELFIPIVQRGAFLPDEELTPLMTRFQIQDKENLDIMLYYFLFRTTNFGTELRVVQ